MRLRELAASRVRFGYRRLTVLLKREGWAVNAKRIYRLYTEEGLTVRTKQRKKAASRQRVPLGLATKPNQRWCMDFVSDRFVDGRWFRVLTVVDQFTRECLLLYADSALSGEKVAAELERCRQRTQSSDVDHRDNWKRVRQSSHGCMGVWSRNLLGLHPTRQASGERIH